jgi:hypothetical protein
LEIMLPTVRIVVRTPISSFLYCIINLWAQFWNCRAIHSLYEPTSRVETCFKKQD